VGCEALTRSISCLDLAIGGFFVAAVKAEIIEELEKHRDAELAEQREKRHKTEAEKARKSAEQSTDTDDAKVIVSYCRTNTSLCPISFLFVVCQQLLEHQLSVCCHLIKQWFSLMDTL